MKKFVLFLMFLLGVQTPTFATDADWLANEVLTQLSELRREIQSMKKQIQVLQSDLVTLKKNKIRTGENKAAISSFEFTDGNILGNESAKFAIVEFTDYQCPYCGRHAKGTFEKIKQKYVNTGILQYMVRDYPLSFHQQAKSAAVAAACAAKQGKYWDMHKTLFESPGKVKREEYQMLAEQIGLDLNSFDACLTDPEQLKKVKNDVALANSIGITGTPAFLIGRLKEGKMIELKAMTGAQPFSSFSRIIDAMIN